MAELIPRIGLAAAVADGLPDLERRGELLPRRRVLPLLDVDRGEVVPGGGLAAAVGGGRPDLGCRGELGRGGGPAVSAADRLPDLERRGELLPRRRVLPLLDVDRGEVVPGGGL